MSGVLGTATIPPGWDEQDENEENMPDPVVLTLPKPTPEPENFSSAIPRTAVGLASLERRMLMLKTTERRRGDKIRLTKTQRRPISEKVSTTRLTDTRVRATHCSQLVGELLLAVQQRDKRDDRLLLRTLHVPRPSLSSL